MEEALGRLHFDLMQFEMQLVEQLDDIGKDFERNISDLFASLLEQVQSQYPPPHTCTHTHTHSVIVWGVNTSL